MANSARVGDTHMGTCSHGALCCPHSVTGTIVSGSGNVYVNGRQSARDGDQVVHNCPHCGTGYIVASAQSIIVNGRATARLGDTVIYPGGSGTIVEGSGNVDAE